MPLFDRPGFDTGSWAGPLATALRRKHIIPGRQPKARLYRSTWTHWIQVDPSDFSGPAHWLGKPAIVARDGSLCAGYYVERGLQQHAKPEYVITSQWHWYAFRACLTDPQRRSEISSVMQMVDTAVCNVSAFCAEQHFQESSGGEMTLGRLAEFCDACPAGEWIDAFLGARWPRDECLNLQERIVDRLVGPLLRGCDLEAVVLEVRQRLLAP